MIGIKPFIEGEQLVRFASNGGSQTGDFIMLVNSGTVFLIVRCRQDDGAPTIIQSLLSN